MIAVHSKSMIRALSLLLIAFSGHLLAQQPPRPEAMDRALLPITVRDLPGAFGTRWTTDLWFKIDGNARIAYVPSLPISFCDPPCPDLFVYDPDTSFVRDFYRTHATEPPGMLIYIDRATAATQHFSLRLQETTGAIRMEALQLPVVPESDFRGDGIQILGIPAKSSTRAMLRVYGIDPDLLGDVRVRAFRETESVPQALVFDRTVSLRVMQVVHLVGEQPFKLRPPAAELNLADLVPAGMDGVRLELTPLTAGLRIWGFVSLTDNVTQQVALRTP
ncbi:MAG: hypothetical protein JWM82_3248 [Myxococcales bacterium]|nr:hypothetical protein [Myxococcales bacterium]